MIDPGKAPREETPDPSAAIGGLRELAEKARERAPGPWHCATNKHPTTDGRPWGAMELRQHPAGGAGKSLFTWTGEEQRDLAAFIAAVSPEVVLALCDVAEAVQAWKRGYPGSWAGLMEALTRLEAMAGGPK